ncbi:FGGY-family carbohydrate kinase [Janthinobacterium sp. HLX7-2]|uniref:FGGY-family carbohydrate kinase n=1 Tax=Janthinobacterium sp. HLX7-2 TaxID=1259331 RepID=UPI003F29BC72
MDYVIGVDIGTQSTKALLVDCKGAIVAQHAHGYQVDTPRPLWAEQWPAVWYDAVLACVRQVLLKSGLPAESIKAICVSSLYGGSGIAVDAAMEPLHPCLIWMDRRATEEVAWVKEHVDLERLYAVTGNGVDSYYGYTKMLWLKRHRSAIWEKTQYFLPPNSYINYLLCGEVAVDHSSAGNIGGVYDLAARRWSAPMLEELGIPARMMPTRLVDSSEVVGTLLPLAAQQLGLLAGTPVIAGGVDAAVATFAAGASRAGQHVAMIGTSMCWGYIHQQVDARHGLISMPHVFNSQSDLYVFGGAITAGASVSWFRDEFCQADVEAARQLGHADVHQLMEDYAQEIPPGSDGVLFLPYLMGERSPIWDARASGAFLGLSLYHRRAHLYRAVLEGVSFALKHNIEAGAKGAGNVALDDKLIVVGGAAQSSLWMQIIADITGYPVYTIAENVEAALGAALLAALGTGLIGKEAAQRGWVTLVPRSTPQAAASSAYRHAFARYCEAYPALQPLMHRIHSDNQE